MRSVTHTSTRHAVERRNLNVEVRRPGTARCTAPADNARSNKPTGGDRRCVGSGVPSIGTLRAPLSLRLRPRDAAAPPHGIGALLGGEWVDPLAGQSRRPGRRRPTRLSRVYGLPRHPNRHLTGSSTVAALGPPFGFSSRRPSTDLSGFACLAPPFR